MTVFAHTQAMRNDSNDWIGGAWLVATYGLTLVLPLSVISCIGGRRALRVVEEIKTSDLVAWILDEPTGHYARRAGFFYEFLTGREL